MTSRLHAAHVVALVHGDEFRAPKPGVFVPSVARGDLVSPGGHLGRLVVLGQSYAVVAGNAGGVVTAEHRGAVAYGDAIVVVDPSAQLGGAAVAVQQAAASAVGLVFRAPTSGRFYSRSAPDKPPFVEAGTQLAAGATVCLLEVMKTFHRVTYSAAGGLPDAAKVTAVLVADGADVNAGDPLLSLE